MRSDDLLQTILQTLLGEVGLLFVVGIVLLLIARAPPGSVGGRTAHCALAALAFPAAAALFIAFPIVMPAGLTYDFSAGPALLAGIFGGLPAALLTALAGGAARIAAGGPIAFGGALGVAVCCATGLAFRRALAARGRRVDLRIMAVLALAGSAAVVPTFFAGVPASRALAALEAAMPGLVPVNLIAVLALGSGWLLGLRLRSVAQRQKVLEAALDQAGNGILITDASDDQVIVYANRAVTTSTGHAPADLIGRSPRLFNTGLEDQPGLDILRAAIRGRTPCSVDLLNVHKDGGQFVNRLSVSPVADAQGVVTHFVGVQDDVTLVREADHFVNLVTDRLPLAVAFVGLNGTIKVANRTFAARYGLNRDEVIGQNAGDVASACEHTRLRAALEAPDGGESLEREFDWRPAPGAPGRRVRETFYPALSGRASIGIGVVWAIEDITGQREAEEALRQAYKMNAIGNLTGGIAHDFNNLNAVVVGNLELLESEGLSAKESTLLSEALNAACRSAELTRSLLAFAQKAPLRPESVPVDRRVDDLEGLLRTSVPAYVALDIRVAPDAGVLEVDRAGFENAILNLVLNARDAIGRQAGRIVVAARAVGIGADGLAEDGAFAGDPGPPPAGRYVAVSVSDTGAGVAPEIRTAMLEPFATTKGPEIGTGLGLAMVHGFVRQSGGFLRIAEAEGGGTIVTLYLPMAAATSARSEAPSRPGHGTLRVAGRPVALVVEDEAAIRRLLTRRLSALGFAVTSCATGDEAMEVLLTGRPVDLLLTDAVLAGRCQGADVASAARRRRPFTRIIMISGYPGEPAGERTEDLCDAFVAKPFTEASLLAAIEACMPTERINATAPAGRSGEAADR